MIAALTDFWLRFEPTEAASAPPPRPRRPPVLMGDILTARCGEPDLLIRWREDRAGEP